MTGDGGCAACGDAGAWAWGCVLYHGDGMGIGVGCGMFRRGWYVRLLCCHVPCSCVMLCDVMSGADGRIDSYQFRARVRTVG